MTVMDVPLNEQTERSHRVSSTGPPQPDGTLNKADRMKIRHYRQIYVDRSDHLVLLPATTSTSGLIYEDFVSLA
jgi:hypothetical protein